MGIFGGLFRALGFESEDDESKPVKKKTKKTEPKASYNLKKGKIEKPDHAYIKTVYGMGYMWIGGSNK